MSTAEDAETRRFNPAHQRGFTANSCFEDENQQDFPSASSASSAVKLPFHSQMNRLPMHRVRRLSNRLGKRRMSVDYPNQILNRRLEPERGGRFGDQPGRS